MSTIKVKFNDGRECPILGIGTWKVCKILIPFTLLNCKCSVIMALIGNLCLFWAFKIYNWTYIAQDGQPDKRSGMG